MIIKGLSLSLKICNSPAIIPVLTGSKIISKLYVPDGGIVADSVLGFKPKPVPEIDDPNIVKLLPPVFSIIKVWGVGEPIGTCP